MHSRKSQPHRTRVADAFREGTNLIMFSSDVSARGLDYPDVTAVEPLLCVVTDPMKSVTKLGRASTASNGPAMPPTPLEQANGYESLKRKYRETLEVHAQQISQMRETQTLILQELHTVTSMLQTQRAGGR